MVTKKKPTKKRSIKKKITKKRSVKRSISRKTSKSSTATKKLEAKIADLEARLSKLSSDASKVEPKPKPAETAPEPKPAETAPEPAKVSPPDVGVPLHERFREIPTADWNDQKSKVPGFTAPGNKYFATKQRLAYHPEAKKFGTWINDGPASEQSKPKPAETAPEPKPAEKTPEELAKAEEAKAAADKAAAEKAAAAAAKDAYAAEMAKKGATLPKGFIKDAKANTGH